MTKIKFTRYTFGHKSFVAVLVLMFSLLSVVWVEALGVDSYKTFWEGKGPEWAQAVGTILAVWVALFSTQKQHVYEEARKAEAERKERIQRFGILGALLEDLASRCRGSAIKIQVDTAIPALQIEFLKIPRVRLESIPVLELPDEGFALIFNELLLKMESAEIAISALQLSNNQRLSDQVAELLVSVEKRALEGYYEITRLRSQIMTEEEKKDCKRTKFRVGSEAREFVDKHYQPILNNMP